MLPHAEHRYKLLSSFLIFRSINFGYSSSCLFERTHPGDLSCGGKGHNGAVRLHDLRMSTNGHEVILAPNSDI